MSFESARPPILRARIIAPDSSHWAKWLDAALSNEPAKRAEAQGFHATLLDSGRIPLLSWHHLEELLSIEDDGAARERIAFLQSLPLIAYLRLPHEEAGLGAVTDILAAEVRAVVDGCADPRSVRDHAAATLLHTGTGEQAIGSEAWVWEVVRPEFRKRNAHAKFVASIGPFRSFDETQTIAEIAKGSMQSSAGSRAKIAEIRASLVEHLRLRGDPAIVDIEAAADDFIDQVTAHRPPPQGSVRDFLVFSLTAQGVDADEIEDHMTLAALNRLAMFRTKLRVVASKIGLPFERLKRVDMALLPHWRIEQALKTHGQQRPRVSGSDVIDGYLAALAAYTAELFVDKRTAEDFRRVLAKAPDVGDLIGKISKAAHYSDLVRPSEL